MQGTFFWHIDGVTIDMPPPKATLLTARRISARGGQTEFSNTYAAYEHLPQEEKQAYVQKVIDLVVKTKEVTNVTASVQLEHEWKYFASSEGSYIEQEVWTTTPSFSVTARKDGETRTRTFTGVPG